MLIKASWLNPCTPQMKIEACYESWGGGEATTQNSCFLRYCRLPLPMLLRRQHKYLISTIILSSFTFQYMREQQYI